MALAHTRLDKTTDFVGRMIHDNGVKAAVKATTDRREALRGADYVVVMIQVGGVEGFEYDYEIPMKYGVDNCIGDTMGPGDILCAQRHIPALLKTLVHGHVTSAFSVREIESSLAVHGSRLYHCGLKPVKRSTLCDALEKRDQRIFESEFNALAAKARQIAGNTGPDTGTRSRSSMRRPLSCALTGSTGPGSGLRKER